MKDLTIGTVARQAGVNVETVRYYERQGLIAPPGRRPNGYRAFGDDAVTRIRFIRSAQRLGFTLQEVAELLALRAEPAESCDSVRARAESKVEDIDARISDLQRMRAGLRTLVRQCEAGRPVEECPIIASFEQEAVT